MRVSSLTGDKSLLDVDSASRPGEDLPTHLPCFPTVRVKPEEKPAAPARPPQAPTAAGVTEPSPPGLPPPQPRPSRRPQPGCARRRRLLTAPARQKTHRWPRAAGDEGLRGDLLPGKSVASVPARESGRLERGCRAPLPAAGPRSSGRCGRPPCVGPAPSRPSSRPARAAGQCGPRRAAGFNHLLRSASSKSCRLPCRGAPAQAPRRGGGEPRERFSPFPPPQELFDLRALGGRGRCPPPLPHSPQDHRPLGAGAPHLSALLAAPLPLSLRSTLPDGWVPSRRPRHR